MLMMLALRPGGRGSAHQKVSSSNHGLSHNSRAFHHVAFLVTPALVQLLPKARPGLGFLAIPTNGSRAFPPWPSRVVPGPVR